MKQKLLVRGVLTAVLLGLIAAIGADPRPETIPGDAVRAPDVTTETLADDPHKLFRTAGACMACHNGLVTADGEDVSIGTDWRASIMANSSRDPYWQAAVRREVLDHPVAQAEIEAECSTCHMPMAHVQARAQGSQPEVFAHLPVHEASSEMDRLAADGVSCTTCHQITSARLGSPESFTGGFVVDSETGVGERRIFGPFEVDDGRATVMRSASNFRPTEASHLQSSELCATCHTLYTNARGPGGEIIGELPEQVPFLEWRHSAYRDEQSCQSCHMPVVEDTMAISSVLGQPRAGFSRHVFRGGNFFMLRMLNRYRDELGVEALPNELDVSADRTVRHLQESSAHVQVDGARVDGGKLVVDVAIENRAGHKLPTAYPSRRAWIHFVARDADGSIVFESGAPQPDGLIKGNDNDVDPARFEPHYTEILSEDHVQIYEAILAGPDGKVTTGLLTAVRYIKDNRLLPRGFDKLTAEADIAVQGGAVQDDDFDDAGDRIRYVVDLAGRRGPFDVTVELWYQPIGFRWAQNLAPYDAAETKRFVRYYDAMSTASGLILAGDSVSVP